MKNIKNINKSVGILLVLALMLYMLAACAEKSGTATQAADRAAPIPIEEIAEVAAVATTEEPEYPELKVERTSDETRIYETMDYVFIPDNDVPGTWQTVAEIYDYSQTIYANYYTGEIKPRNGDSLKEQIDYHIENNNPIAHKIVWEEIICQTLKFHPDGKINVRYGTHSLTTEWTRGHIVNLFGKTISKYITATVGGTDYMFVEKKDMYIYEGEKWTLAPASLLVLEKTAEYTPNAPENPEDLLKYDTIERDYDWYINQNDTGEYWNVNCGPAAAVMAAKWYDRNIQTTVEEARERFIKSDKHGWSLKTMRDFLDSENVPYEAYAGIKYEDMMKHLDRGNIMILAVDMQYINQYSWTNVDYIAGHYFIVKGRRNIDGKEYFQVHDPAFAYDCLYPCNEVLEASEKFYSGLGYCIVIKQNSETLENPNPKAEPEYINIKGSLYNTMWTELQAHFCSGSLNFDDFDIEALKHMVNLKRLILSMNQITDVSVLANLTGLTDLNLVGNQISDITPLAGLTKLTSLHLSDNPIGDIGILAGLKNLSMLSLGGSPIGDIGVLAGLTNLKCLILYDAQISDISAIKNLTNLTTLNLAYNPITDISPLANMTNLEELFLVGTQISDIGILAKMTDLTTLFLSGTKITDISVLENLTNLKTLTLGDIPINDISVLANLTNLTTLNLTGNPNNPPEYQISDISALANLTNLTRLYMGHNQISDIAPLMGLTNLTELYLQENPIGEDQIAKLREALPNTKIVTETTEVFNGGK